MATPRKKPARTMADDGVLHPSDRAQPAMAEIEIASADEKVKAKPCRCAAAMRLGGGSWWTALTLEVVIVALLIAILCVTVAKGDEKGKPYGNNYAAAYRDSRATGRPLLVMVSAEWCTPCQEIMASFAAEFPKRGCFVRLNWDQDQQTIGDLLPSDRMTLPSLWIWERDSKGEWSRRSFHGAPAIRGWIRPPQRPGYVIPPPAKDGHQ